jgi:hypothetical protein
MGDPWFRLCANVVLSPHFDLATVLILKRIPTLSEKSVGTESGKSLQCEIGLLTMLVVRVRELALL